MKIISEVFIESTGGVGNDFVDDFTKEAVEMFLDNAYKSALQSM